MHRQGRHYRNQAAWPRRCAHIAAPAWVCGYMGGGWSASLALWCSAGQRVWARTDDRCGAGRGQVARLLPGHQRPHLSEYGGGNRSVEEARLGRQLRLRPAHARRGRGGHLQVGQRAASASASASASPPSPARMQSFVAIFRSTLGVLLRLCAPGSQDRTTPPQPQREHVLFASATSKTSKPRLTAHVPLHHLGVLARWDWLRLKHSRLVGLKRSCLVAGCAGQTGVLTQLTSSTTS